MHIKKGDNVIILSGDDKGKTGKVAQAFPAKGTILVEGINVMKKHERPRQEGQKGQLVERAMPFHASKARLADGPAKAPKAVKAVKAPVAAAESAAPKKAARKPAAKKAAAQK